MISLHILSATALLRYAPLESIQNVISPIFNQFRLYLSGGLNLNAVVLFSLEFINWLSSALSGL